MYAALVGASLIGCEAALFAFPSIKHSAEVWFRTVTELVDVADPACIVVYDELVADLAGHLRSGGRTPALITPSAPATAAAPEPATDPDDVALLQFSSGTTGLKKGVRLTHRQVLSQVDRYADAIGLDPSGDVVCSWLPLYHDMGFVACCLMPLLTGTPLVAMSPFDWVRRPRMLLEAITAHRGTLSWAPNFSLALLARSVQDADIQGLDLSSLRGLINCSEPITAAAMQAFDERFAPVGWRPEAHGASYALAENTFAVTSGGMGRPMSVTTVGGRVVASCGTPVADTQVRIVDGEIAIRSPSLFAGYHKGPAAAFDEGWFLTGDVGFLLDGELYVSGRKKDMLIIRGENHFPQDLEEAACLAPGVIAGRAVALGRFDEESGTEALVVIAETLAEDDADRAGVAAAIARELAGHAGLVASSILLAPKGWLRKSTSGKLARAANAERLADPTLWRWSGQRPGATSASFGAGEPRPLDALDRSIADLIAAELQSSGFDATCTPAEILEMNLLMSGAMDSLAFAGLLVAVERQAGVILADDDLAFSDRLATGQGIVEVLRMRKAGGAARDSSARENDHDAKCRLFSESTRDFDVIILGSSRSMLLRTAAARERGLSAFNMAVSGPSVEDLAALMRFVSDVAVRPPTWLFCEWHVDMLPSRILVTSQLMESAALGGYLPELLPAGSPLLAYSRDKEGTAQAEHNRNQILRWLNTPGIDIRIPIRFDAGVGDLRHLGAPDDEVLRAINADQPLKLSPGATVSKQHLALRCIEGRKILPDRQHALAAFLAHLASLQPDLRVVMFEPPQHPSLGPFLRASVEGYDERRHLVMEYIRRTQRPKMLLYDLRDASIFGGDPLDFHDTWHMGGHNGRQMMGWLVDRAAQDWGKSAGG